ncbi:ATP-dependent zinc metalloprotease FtsH [Clostridium tepidiprofundi DSM 19306]|uniref:ATP-dependent zinc metalloprotease FtsH n=1 Tax=Clostridium tepidiprofundi DSM 19306 TaxID=1121338 RepID=A0A151B4K7_9CLOT|nr:AAA family ATPase [Clostridium tepidiprofundi]KYH34733.1 ATP-dependent zinc metalloprotease FtsH [Clostridium tepidiprofundi DSM 19306]
MNKNKNKLFIFPLVTAAISLVMFAILNFGFINNKDKLYINFISDLSNKKVSTVYVTDSPKIKVKLTNGTIYETDNPRTNNFKEILLKQGVKVYESSFNSLNESLPLAIFVISIVFMIVLMIKNSKVKAKGLFAASSIDAEAVSDIGFTFEDVAGNEEAKESVKDVVDFLKSPEKYLKYGARMPKGIILYGEPGTGKTLLAKAVAGEAGVPFYAVSGSDFVQIYVGVGAGRIRNLFKKARSHGKAVIFIDEIDAIGKKRDNGRSSGGSDEKDQTLNALLTEMSGFNETEGIIVIAATNRLDMLDNALLRPGRFDRHIEVTLPDVAAREKILNLHLKNKPTKEINIKEWAQKTSYFSGAKLENLVNEAAILACKSNKEFIDDSDMDKAFSIVLAGYEKINRDHIKEKDKKITAIHEAGHALITLNVLPNEKISKVTIIPSTNGAGGYTLSIPEDQMHQNKSYLLKRLMVLLGGRAAEEIMLGKDKITTGAYNDLQRSTELASSMVTQYGMGKSLGLLNISELKKHGISSEGEALKECKELIENLYEDVKSILVKNKETLEKLANKLIEKETLYYEDLIKLR